LQDIASIRETYDSVLEDARATVKAIRNVAQYKSPVYEAAAALGQLVMERSASLRG
jgi:hypothetical protein